MSKVTIVDIANRAGVSFKTVSRVLNRHPSVGLDLRQRVEAAMQDLNYRPNRAARSLKGSRHFTIGFLMAGFPDIATTDNYVQGSAYVSAVQRGILQACHGAGYALVVDWVDMRSKSFAADLRHQLSNLHVDGLVLIPPLADLRAALDILDNLAIPYARIAPGLDPARSLAVGIDDRAAAFTMTRRLQALGHRHIGFITGAPGHIAAGARLTGFREALRAADDDGEPLVAAGNFSFESGMDAGADLLRDSSRPTAIFAANDEMAVGVLAAASLAGLKVPDDLSVAGFDNSVSAHLAWPPLTTVHQPISAMSACAAERLIAAASSRSSLESIHIQLPFEIIERGSTAPLA